MASIITLKYSAKCAQCGTKLPAGTKAKFYNSRHIYGLDCHDKTERQPKVSTFTTSGGTFTNCGCEDYPCCGH
jgi:hypothetical protein